MGSLRVFCFVVAFVLVAAGAAAHGAPSRSRADVPRTCTPEATKALVRTFVRNYNRGRVAVINRLWAPKPRFQWYSTGAPGERIGASAYVRKTLASYFRSRVRVHERLALTRLGAGYDPTRHIVHFGGKRLRSADDLRPRG